MTKPQTECPRCHLTLWLEPNGAWFCTNCHLDLLDMRERAVNTFRPMKALEVVCWIGIYIALPLTLILIWAHLARAQEITTATDVQVGTIAASACDVTDLPANVWTEVLFDDAGEPCSTHASQLQGSCTPNTWNWTIDGHLLFAPAPGYKPGRVRVQVWAGGGNGACYGGSAAPIYCDNPYYKLMKQDETYMTVQGAEVAAPFSVLDYLEAPYFSTPGDGNYQGLWIFAMPIGRPAVCRGVSYHDVGAN